MEAVDIVKEGKGINPLFDYAASNPVAKAPEVSLVKGKPDAESMPLDNPRYERFCQLLAYPDDIGRQRYAYEAYMIAFRDESGEMDKATARVNASRLKKLHPEIEARIKFLDAELKSEVMLHKGAIYAETINEVAGVMRSMSHQREDPKAASVLVNAAKVLLDATGNQPTMKTETTVMGESTDGLGGVRAALAKVISVTKPI